MKISVIMPVFNGAKYLEKAIKSFLEQDYKNKELIIIDGKSTDGSLQIIENHQKQYPNLIHWINEKDSGIYNSRNIALKHIKGDIVGFLGADDILHKDFFKQMTYYTSINPNFDIIYFNGYTIGSDGSCLRRSADINLTKRNLIKFPPFASGEAFYYRKHIFDKFSFNEKTNCTGDYEFNMAILSDKEAAYQTYGVDISAVFNISDGTNGSTILSGKQRIETIAIQFQYARSWKEKLRIFLRRPKFILKNFRKIQNSIVELS